YSCSCSCSVLDYPLPPPMSHHADQLRLRQDRSRLRALLRRALETTPLATSSPERIEILGLACGGCNEAEVLLELPSLLEEIRCGKPAADPRLGVHLVGVDIREREIADAEARCKALAHTFAPEEKTPAGRASFEFLPGDATRISSHRHLSQEFDLVFLRHQNFWDSETTWKKIFAQGLARLTPEGLLVLTSYFDREHLLALDAIEDLGGEVVLSLENKNARSLSTPGKSVDKHLALVRLPTSSKGDDYRRR
ncbi:MAG: hypothetical protein ACC661_03675, partial [Verrucomicrobiales bacterium]